MDGSWRIQAKPNGKQHGQQLSRSQKGHTSICSTFDRGSPK